MTLPLDGILVTDLTQNVAGPFCTQILGDMGAEVIKVERPGTGDDARAWAPPYWGGESATFMGFNRNKKSLALDLKQDAGLEVLKRLVAKSDVFVQSLRAGVVDAMGLDGQRARAINPRLVYCSITAYGTDGPLRDRPGYDPLMQAYAGLMSINGHPGGEPARVGTSIVDMGTGMWGVIGILGALRERETTGRGGEVTTALFETTLMWIGHFAMGYLGSGDVPQPQGSGVQMIVPYQAFPSADGWVLMAAPSDALFVRLTRALDLAELAADPRFVDNPSRVRHRAALIDALSACTRERKTSEIVDVLRQAGVPSAPILTIDAVLSEPQTHASGMLVGASHPRIPDYRSVALPVKWGARRPGVRRVPPTLGEHSEDVLTALGYTRDDVRSLRAQRVVQ